MANKVKLRDRIEKIEEAKRDAVEEYKKETSSSHESFWEGYIQGIEYALFWITTNTIKDTPT